MTANAMIEDYFTNGDPRDLVSVTNALPVEMVEAVDISNAALWLCTDEARYITGTTVPVDAGATLR
jgi:enoyl-[acyl-carrier-protein] reductase (NADH)